MKRLYIVLASVSILVLAGLIGYAVFQPNVGVVDDVADTIASNRYDGDKRLGIQNNRNQSTTVDVVVTRVSTDETVHEGTYRLEPQENRTQVYNLASDASGKIEQYRFQADIGNRSGGVTIRTNKCYGGVVVQVRPGGQPLIYHGICNSESF